MRPAENIENFIKKNRYKASSETHEKVFNNVLKEIENNKKQSNSRARPKIWRIIMKKPMVKIAAAAAILIAVVVGLNPFGGTITFGQVIAPIMNSGTIAYDFFSGNDNEAPLMHDTVVGNRIRREMPNLAMTMIIDLDNQKMLLLNITDRTAAYVDIQGPLQDMTQSYMKFLREAILKYKDNYRNLGGIEIDGQKTIAFEAGNQNEKVLIYADPKTALPVRIDLALGQGFTILKNFQFDFPVEQSLVSMQVPPGYNFKPSELELTSASEQDFIESLRIWAEIINDGTFPNAIGSENAVKQVALLAEKLGQMNLPEQEATQIGINFGKGMLFHQMLDIQNKGQYVGGGVKFGDADSPVFWYQPEGSDTYRVIFGDLHVENVSPEDLPN